MGMVRVSLPSLVCFFCCCFFVVVVVAVVVVVVLLMRDLKGSHSYCQDVTLNILSSVYIFQHTVPRLLLNLENISHFFSKDTTCV